jgi:hypothetical protein
MSFGLSAAAVGLIGAGTAAAVGVYSANKAASAQQDATNSANAVAQQTNNDQLALQREMFNKNVELQQPAIDAGNTARNRLMQLLGLSTGGDGNGSLMKDFSAADFTADPGYQFRLDQGQQALERNAAARGGLLSGAALKDANNYAQGQASQEWQAAYDRFKSNQASKANPLLSLAGSGQVASGALSSAATGAANSGTAALGEYGSTVGNNLAGAGNARASGYVGTANAISNGLGQAYNGYQQNQLLSLLRNSSSGATSAGVYVPESSLPSLQMPTLNSNLNF